MFHLLNACMFLLILYTGTNLIGWFCIPIDEKLYVLFFCDIVRWNYTWKMKVVDNKVKIMSASSCCFSQHFYSDSFYFLMESVWPLSQEHSATIHIWCFNISVQRDIYIHTLASGIISCLHCHSMIHIVNYQILSMLHCSIIIIICMWR